MLFQSTKLGSMTLANRIVMAPMTRSRATGNVPNELLVRYYSARASAGLIITEGTSPSINGLGYPRIPGMFNQRQLEGWRSVTAAVHNRGGKIFVQLMHTGRVSHPLNMSSSAKILAPSAIQLSGQMWTDQSGLQNYPTPIEMSKADIQTTIQEFVDSAELAMAAGFDGVELHAANGYLLEQFLNPKTNQRKDEYGGTAEGRSKFTLEVAGAVAKAIGAKKVGIRLSPYGVFNDTGPFDGIDEFYADLAKKFSTLGLVYIHVVDHSGMGAPPVSAKVKQMIRENFNGIYILSGNYNAERAEIDLQEKKGDLVAFGRPFIANPDLVEKLKEGTNLLQADPNTFYTPGEIGYN
jgi:N-ethylmaleimide reductase